MCKNRRLKYFKQKKINKLKSYLFKMKEFSQIVLGQGPSVSRNGHFCLAKRHFANPEGEMEIKFLIGSFF